ncbi:MAG: hypothetical protein KA764_05370, partial [Anaerolineales bacterium]|nr:hypothetical protein [Anaerolineales bacterium]
MPAVQAAPVPVPIMVVINGAYSANPFGAYLGEILRAEGLNAFDVVQLSALTAGHLTGHQVTVLAETTLTAGQASLLTSYVNGGGRLIAMRPDPQITSLFGLGAAAGTQTDGYLKFESTAAAAGLTTSVLQIHGAANRYALAAGGERVAELYSTRTTGTGYPAVAKGSAGRAVAFTYDLARNVVYMRQGNPALANRVDTLGTGWDAANPPVTRTVHLFGSTNFSGGAPLWIDRELIPVPQADEQMRLLARLVKEQVEPAHPLPQVWYFPGSAKTMLILTGDAHANPTSSFQRELQSLQARNAKISLYMTIGGGVTEMDVLTWQAQGHSFGLHPYAYRPDNYPPYNVTNLASGYTAFGNWFAMTYPAVTRSRTVRHHQVAWQGWTDAADIAVANGIALDTNFYHWGPWLQKADGTWPHGYLTGSGQAMKFIRANGTVLPLYQQMTQLVDEQLVAGAGGGYEGLTAAGAAAVSRQLIDASQAGDYAALMTQYHVDYYSGDSQLWAEATVDYANSLGVPVWNADQWLNFTETRHDASFTNLAWDAASGVLSFNLNAGTGADLTTVLPQIYGGRALTSVTVNGAPAAFTTQIIKGQSMAFVTAASGNRAYQAVYLPAGPTSTPTMTNTPPAGASLTPTAAATATSTSVPPTATSTPTATSLPPATLPATVPFPSTTILDTFDRPDSGLGSNWAGAIGGYAIVSNQASVIGGSDVYWAPAAYGPDQEVYVTIAAVSATSNEQDLLLKAQTPGTYGGGVIEVWYDAAGGRAQVWTFANSQGWVQHGADLPVAFAAGDQFGARARADGTVEVYRNGTLLGVRSVASWPYAANGGYVGLWFVNAAGVRLDNFGGGNVTAGLPTSTPVPPTATATATSNVPLPTVTETPVPPTVTPVPPTATPTPVLDFTDSTLADFRQICALPANVLVSSAGGGAVTLASLTGDDFNGAALNGALWAAGDWSGGAYAPAV